MLTVIRAGHPVNYRAAADLVKDSIEKLPLLDRPVESRGLYFRNGGLSSPTLKILPAGDYHFQLRYSSAKVAMRGIVEMLARYSARELFCRIHIIEVDITRPDGYISIFLPVSDRDVEGNSSTIEEVGNCDEPTVNSSVPTASGNTTLSYPQIYHIPGTHPALLLQPIGIGDPIFIATYILFSHAVQQDLFDQIGNQDRVLDYDGFTKQERGLTFRAKPLRSRHFEIRLSTVTSALQGLDNVLAFWGYHELKCKIHIDIYRPGGGDGEVSIVHTDDEGVDIPADPRPSNESAGTEIAARETDQYANTTASYPPTFHIPGTQPPLILQPIYYHSIIPRLYFVLGSQIVEAMVSDTIQHQGDAIVDRHGLSFTERELNFQFRSIPSHHYVIRYSTFAAALIGVGEMMQTYGYRELMCKIHVDQFIAGGGDGVIEVVKAEDEANGTVVVGRSRADEVNLTERSPDSSALDPMLSKEILESHSASNLSTAPRYPQTYTVPGSVGPLILAPRLPAGDPITPRILIMGVQRIRNKVRLLIERYGDEIIGSEGFTWPYAQEFAIHIRPLPTKQHAIRYSTVLSAIQGMDNLLRRYGRFELTSIIHIAVFRLSGGDGEIRFFKPTLGEEPVAPEPAALFRRDNRTLGLPRLFEVPHSHGPLFLDEFHAGLVIQRGSFQDGILVIQRDIRLRLAQYGDQVIPWGGFVWHVFGLTFLVTPLVSERNGIKTSTVLDILRGMGIILEMYGWHELTADIHLRTYRPHSGDGRIRVFLQQYDSLSATGEDTKRIHD
ncbi:MAG: hypothetical protein Q9167_004277 [Letrouitia subvulpina]